MRFLFIVLLSVLITSAFPRQGQGQRPQRTPEENARTQVEWMKTDLKLDEATSKKVYDVVLKYAKQSSEERQKLIAAGDREGMRAKMAEINTARDKELKVILGDKNFELFKTKEAERRQAARPPRQN